MLALQPSPNSTAPVSELPNQLTLAEWNALAVAVTPGSRHARQAARRTLHRVLEPIAQAGEALRLDPRAISWIQRVVLREMHARHTACSSWDADEWIAVAATALCFRSNVLAAACWLGRLSGEQVLAAGVYPTELARRLFGRSQLEREVERVRAYLHTVGYGPSAIRRHSLMTSLAILFVLVGRAELEALTVDVILWVGDRHRVASEIHEHTLASGVLQPHDHILAIAPAVVVLTELGVAPAVWIGLLVFQMQQLQRDVLAALVVVVDLEPIRLGPTWPILISAAFEQSSLERGAVQIFGQLPAQPSPLRTFQGTFQLRTLVRLMPTLRLISCWLRPCAAKRKTSSTWRMDTLFRGTELLLAEVGYFQQ